MIWPLLRALKVDGGTTDSSLTEARSIQVVGAWRAPTMLGLGNSPNWECQSCVVASAGVVGARSPSTGLNLQ